MCISNRCLVRKPGRDKIEEYKNEIRVLHNGHLKENTGTTPFDMQRAETERIQ